MATMQHRSVMLEEAVDALDVRPQGLYVDCTFGRGGHSRFILQRLTEGGELLGIDKDPQAVATGEELADSDGRFHIRRGSFADLTEMVSSLGWQGVDGILMDLGVSSPQLDDAARGFSFLRDGPLDMRMDPEVGEGAAEWLRRAKEADIARVLKTYGDERYSRRIAAAIVAENRVSEIVTTAHLADVISKAHPSWEKGKHPATRSFQAIRIHINKELDDLNSGLMQTVELLKTGGRLAVISFHSLEDRMVKRFMRAQSRGDAIPKGVPVTADQLNCRMRLVGGAVMPSEEEVSANPRARSAVLRVAEKL